MIASKEKVDQLADLAKLGKEEVKKTPVRKETSQMIIFTNASQAHPLPCQDLGTPQKIISYRYHIRMNN